MTQQITVFLLMNLLLKWSKFKFILKIFSVVDRDLMGFWRFYWFVFSHQLEIYLVLDEEIFPNGELVIVIKNQFLDLRGIKSNTQISICVEEYFHVSLDFWDFYQFGASF